MESFMILARITESKKCMHEIILYIFAKNTNFMRTSTFIKHTFLLIALLGSSSMYGQGEKYSTLVNTDSIKFRVGEPTGFMADVDNAAQFGANVILYTSLDNVNNGDAMIQVTGVTKKDVDSGKELEMEIAQYREDYPTLKEKELVTAHKLYKCFSSFLSVNGQFYKYITYVNPGDASKKVLIVIMYLPKREATGAELEGYKKVVESLEML